MSLNDAQFGAITAAWNQFRALPDNGIAPNTTAEQAWGLFSNYVNQQANVRPPLALNTIAYDAKQAIDVDAAEAQRRFGQTLFRRSAPQPEVITKEGGIIGAILAVLGYLVFGPLGALLGGAAGLFGPAIVAAVRDSQAPVQPVVPQTGQQPPQQQVVQAGTGVVRPGPAPGVPVVFVPSSATASVTTPAVAVPNNFGLVVGEITANGHEAGMVVSANPIDTNAPRYRLLGTMQGTNWERVNITSIQQVQADGQPVPGSRPHTCNINLATTVGADGMSECRDEGENRAAIARLLTAVNANPDIRTLPGNLGLNTPMQDERGNIRTYVEINGRQRQVQAYVDRGRVSVVHIADGNNSFQGGADGGWRGVFLDGNGIGQQPGGVVLPMTDGRVNLNDDETFRQFASALRLGVQGYLAGPVANDAFTEGATSTRAATGVPETITMFEYRGGETYPAATGDNGGIVRLLENIRSGNTRYAARTVAGHPSPSRRVGWVQIADGHQVDLCGTPSADGNSFILESCYGQSRDQHGNVVETPMAVPPVTINLGANTSEQMRAIRSDILASINAARIGSQIGTTNENWDFFHLRSNSVTTVPARWAIGTVFINEDNDIRILGTLGNGERPLHYTPDTPASRSARMTMGSIGWFYSDWIAIGNGNGFIGSAKIAVKVNADGSQEIDSITMRDARGYDRTMSGVDLQAVGVDVFLGPRLYRTYGVNLTGAGESRTLDLAQPSNLATFQRLVARMRSRYTDLFFVSDAPLPGQPARFPVIDGQPGVGSPSTPAVASIPAQPSLGTST